MNKSASEMIILECRFKRTEICQDQLKSSPTLTGEAASTFLKRADAAERRYKERKEAGTLRDITKDPGYISMKKILKNSTLY